LADKSTRRKHAYLANRFGERAKSSRQHASVLRELLHHPGNPVELIKPAAEEATGT
jgi:hypothetical protein